MTNTLNVYSKRMANFMLSVSHSSIKILKSTGNWPHDTWLLLMENRGIRGHLNVIMAETVPIALKNSSLKVIEDYKKWTIDASELLMNAYKVDGFEYTGILHGDCWSNNVMFKYKEPKTNSGLEDITLLDFQLMRIGSVCHDLSYFFYSGGSKELFAKLEDYLDIYYESFSATVEELGSDPQKILPRSVITDHWKRYARYGMCMAILLTKIKLISKDDITKKLQEQKTPMSLADIPCDEYLYHHRLRDIVEHMHQVGAL